MTYSKTDLQAASEAGIISAGQLETLLAFLQSRGAASPSSPKFDVVHVLWYAGALIVIAAMGLFSTLAFSQMGGQALTATALVYAALFAYAGHYLWTVKNLRTPGGLMIAVAVSRVRRLAFWVAAMPGVSGSPGYSVMSITEPRWMPRGGRAGPSGYAVSSP